MATPHTRAWQAFEENLDSIGHMLALSSREAVALKTQAARLRTFTGTLSGKSLMTKLGRAKLVRWLNRIVKTLKTSGDRMQTINRWQVVMMVTCIEAYLQDVLATAARLDPELMKNSEQHAQYADVIAAISLDALADERGVPAYIIFSDVSLREMARNYPTNSTEFRRIPGVGEQKLKEFAEPFLDEIKGHLASRPAPTL